MLIQSNFNLIDVDTNEAELALNIETKILKLVFKQPCTRYSAQFYVISEYITQIYIDTDGQLVVLNSFCVSQTYGLSVLFCVYVR